MNEIEKRIGEELPDLVAAFVDSSIRILYNSDKDTFVKIFGHADGPYLWDKFTGHYNGDQEGAFICYLDHKNQRKLAVAVIEYAQKNDERAK